MSRRSAYQSQPVITILPPRKGQASISTYSARMRTGVTALLVPQGALISTGGTLPRAAKRNYAETDDDFDDDRRYDEDFSAGGSGAGGNGTPAPVAIKSRPAIMTNHVYHTEEQLEAAAELPETLIPIRINLDMGSYRLSDFFLWNLSERLTTPEQFSQIMCIDLDIPPNVYGPQIAQAIRTQIEEYAPVATIDLPPGIQNVIVQLSLHLAKHLYEDKFEWDLASGGRTIVNEDDNTSDIIDESGFSFTPEQFAKTVVKDMGLSGEFYPAIAHSIYEVLIRLKKEACEGHLSTEVDNDAAYGAESGWRVDQEGLGAEWAPTVEELTQEEIERREVERERNIRRLRRETAKFGDVGGRDSGRDDGAGFFGSKKRRRKTTMF
ncbi:uncharacterized protein V1518DRAFT_421447 [Limtongia smithiae]|uniref:uncharacterized protein n=1 Tax=Limtongia smithiae TaxID=1125753 RepID=UPI0034CEDE01